MYSIANRFGIDVSSVSLWVNKYKAMGVDAFSTNQNKHYTKEEKEQAIAAYLHGEGSLMSICKKFKMIIPGLSEPPVRTLRATIPENESHIFR